MKNRIQGKHLKGLRIAALALTVIAAGAVLIGRQTFEPVYSMIASSIMATDTFPLPDTRQDYSDVNTIHSTSTIFGIATGGGTIYHDQNYLDAYFAQLNKLGVSWIRSDVDWSMVQSQSRDQYDWSRVDRLVTTAQRYHVHIVGILTYTPQWARSVDCPSNHCPPSNPSDFAAYAQTAAMRYKGAINVWEIWNEPNTGEFWAPNADAHDYGKLLSQTYTSIKEANPQAFIITGGLAPVDDYKTNIAPTTFVRTLYIDGYQNTFDAVALHPYTYPTSITYKATWNGWLNMKNVYNVMTHYQDASKKIWITEFGAPTFGSGVSHELDQNDKFAYGKDYMSEDAQRELIQNAATYYMNNVSWIRSFFAYNLIDTNSTSSPSNLSPENFYGLLRFNESPKSSYWAYKTIMASSTN